MLGVEIGDEVLALLTCNIVMLLEAFNQGLELNLAV